MESADADLLRILVTTDNHLGYLEKDPVRGNDSLDAFKEIMKIAKESDVDFILQGGDLFHDNKPSRRVVHRTMELLRFYCMGDRPCAVEFRSDPTTNFVSSFPVVNYEDPNYNVSIPVFAIHGNHDDPTGDDLSAMDILSVSGLINYFGKSPDVESIKVSPILLQKGSTRLALYGLGSIRDERLHRSFKRGKVVFVRPPTDEGDWFNILVLHQNRARHGVSNYIPTSYLPSFIDLVIWAHEHECRPEPEYVTMNDDDDLTKEQEEEEELGDGGFYVYQPGSSVATSLCEGEVMRKHIGILHIKNTTFKVDPVPLQSVRPFVMDTVSLSHTGIDLDDNRATLEYLAEKVNGMIDKVHEEQPSDKLPLVRLRVDYSGGYSVANYTRFGQQFVEKVANPRTILNWSKKKQPTTLRKKASNDDAGDEAEEEEPLKPDSENTDVSDLLKDQLKHDHLTLLSGGSLIGALAEFVNKSENEAISDFVKSSLQQTQEFLKAGSFPETELEDQVQLQRPQIMQRQEEATESTRQRFAELRSQRADAPAVASDNDSELSSDGESNRTAARGGRGRGSRGRGDEARGRGRGSRGGRGGTRGRGRGGTQTQTTLTSASGSSSTRGRAKKTTTAKKPSNTRPAVVYEDDSDEDIITTPLRTSRKRTSTQYSGDSVDLTQDEDSNPFAFPSTSSSRTISKRRKR